MSVQVDVDFKVFKQMVERQVDHMVEGATALFVTDVDKDDMWDTYLDSFPQGTNEIFRERRYYDCSCCRHFIKQFGNVVAVDENYKVVTIWDGVADHAVFDPVAIAMSNLVLSAPICDVFVTKESAFGTDKNHEQTESGEIITWNHFRAAIPNALVYKGSDTVSGVQAKHRDTKGVLYRSVTEISQDAIETVLELIASKSLYRGEEWEGPLNQFLALHADYHRLPGYSKDPYLWLRAAEDGPVVGRIKNHSIGVLLADVTNNVDLNEAVRKYEQIVAPTNYKRPKPIFTQKMVKDAQKTVEDLGLTDALPRRFAVVDDISINNVLFANRDARHRMDVFSQLEDEAVVNPKKFDHVGKVAIERFIEKVLPTCTSVEVYLENSHIPNLVSVIAPKYRNAPPLFKWGNNFSWAYNGNIADSMKERVAQMGGKVDGVLRFSIQWNEDGDNNNDFDAHCVEPGGNRIYYGSKVNHNTGGNLDVDIITPRDDVYNKAAVENITWPRLRSMDTGKYQFMVHCYSHRGGTNGFRAEIEFNGKIYAFSYDQNIAYKKFIPVANVFLDKDKFKIEELLPSRTAQRTEWGLATNRFHKVSLAMLSPNYWENKVGNQHYMFILEGCKNPNLPNGFFNEFLRQDLAEHKRVFEALGSKMKVEPQDEQLSGLGFSSTQRNHIVCKVEGQTSRVIKVVF